MKIATGKLFIVAALSPLLIAAGPTTAPTADTPSSSDVSGGYPRASLELLNHVQTQLKSVASVQADFEQHNKMAMLKHTLTITGHFAVKKPDRVLWVVDKPVRSAICVKGDVLRSWDEDTNAVQVIQLGGDPTFKAILDQIQAWFLGDYKSLGNSYDVFVIANDPLSLRFAAREGSMIFKLVKSIDLKFAKNELNIDQLVIRQASGDSTELQFLNAKLNQDIPDNIWEIPPK